MSRKALVSLPRRKATSGLMTSPTSIAEAFLAMRWVSITSWLAAAISRAPLPTCSLRAATCSVRSSMTGFLMSMVATSLAQDTRFFSWPSTAAAFFSVSLHNLLRASSSGRTASGEAGTEVPATSPPLVRRSRSWEKVSFDSRNWPKAVGLP